MSASDLLHKCLHSSSQPTVQPALGFFSVQIPDQPVSHPSSPVSVRLSVQEYAIEPPPDPVNGPGSTDSHELTDVVPQAPVTSWKQALLATNSQLPETISLPCNPPTRRGWKYIPPPHQQATQLGSSSTTAGKPVCIISTKADDNGSLPPTFLVSRGCCVENSNSGDIAQHHHAVPSINITDKSTVTSQLTRPQPPTFQGLQVADGNGLDAHPRDQDCDFQATSPTSIQYTQDLYALQSSVKSEASTSGCTAATLLTNCIASAAAKLIPGHSLSPGAAISQSRATPYVTRDPDITFTSSLEQCNGLTSPNQQRVDSAEAKGTIQGASGLIAKGNPLTAASLIPGNSARSPTPTIQSPSSGQQQAQLPPGLPLTLHSTTTSITGPPTGACLPFASLQHKSPSLQAVSLLTTSTSSTPPCTQGYAATLLQPVTLGPTVNPEATSSLRPHALPFVPGVNRSYQWPESNFPTKSSNPAPQGNSWNSNSGPASVTTHNNGLHNSQYTNLNQQQCGASGLTYASVERAGVVNSDLLHPQRNCPTSANLHPRERSPDTTYIAYSHNYSQEQQSQAAAFQPHALASTPDNRYNNSGFEPHNSTQPLQHHTSCNQNLLSDPALTYLYALGQQYSSFSEADKLAFYLQLCTDPLFLEAVQHVNSASATTNMPKLRIQLEDQAPRKPRPEPYPSGGSETATHSSQHNTKSSQSIPRGLGLQSALQPAATASSRRTAYVDGASGWSDLGEGSEVGYWPGTFQASNIPYLQHFMDSVEWQQREIKILGKLIQQPRLIAYFAVDPSMQYTYSGLTVHPEQFTPELLEIKRAVEELSGAEYNTCLLNYYRHGGDHVSWHADNERLYGNNPTIASVSFGTKREFLLRKNADQEYKIRYWLGEGDVLVMRGTVQTNWMHSIPKRAGVNMPRVNLTFRKVVQLERRKR